jgi:hypothetical protein
MSAAADLFEAAACALASARLSDSPAAAFLAAELLDAGLCVLALTEHAESSPSHFTADEGAVAATALESLPTAANRTSVRAEPELRSQN